GRQCGYCARCPGACRFDASCGFGARSDDVLCGRGSLCECKAPAGSNNCRVIVMDTILIVNAGSSSAKFQVFSVDGEGELRREIKGQLDGIGTRPRLRASGADNEPLADRTYPKESVSDLPAAMEVAGGWLRDELRISPI